MIQTVCLKATIMIPRKTTEAHIQVLSPNLAQRLPALSLLAGFLKSCIALSAKNCGLAAILLFLDKDGMTTFERGWCNPWYSMIFYDPHDYAYMCIYDIRWWILLTVLTIHLFIPQTTPTKNRCLDIINSTAALDTETEPVAATWMGDWTYWWKKSG